MKKRILSFALAIILSFGGIMTPSVHANLEGYSEFEDLIMDYYFLPYAGVNDAAVVQGSSTKLSFHSNEFLSFGKNDYYCVVIYKGGLDDISNQISQGKELEEMDFFYMNALDYRSKGIMNVEWKPDSRYGVGDYSLVCYVLNSETNQIYNQNVMGDRVIYSQEELLFNFRLIMLLDKEYEPDPDKRIDKAFRHMGEDPADEERFDSYVRGGVDVLYEKLIEGGTDPEDYINRLFEFVEEFQDRFNSEISGDEILQLCIKK